MVKANAGKLIAEPELTPQRLASDIFSLLDHPEQIEQLSSRARALGKPNAARDIVDLVETAAGVLPKRQGESS
jgi:UDP-N-acetylglucosamine--N-acetylmuramyl-(pentapeptide) pyrophosphoryl-undecaprenol N-acetylglucosamine transferase